MAQEKRGYGVNEKSGISLKIEAILDRDDLSSEIRQLLLQAMMAQLLIERIQFEDYYNRILKIPLNELLPT